ncbi:hypothetical protein N0V88_007836 [Collariella sp. IMI 366227]|nr:hypothetical protein N0V88_007836 [Collariella sp. IMI 366227]
MTQKTLDSPDHYTVGWIAALPVEHAAATGWLVALGLAPITQDNGFWSVAYIARRVPTVTMFDGISTLPRKVAEYEEYSLRGDKERRVRIDRFIAAIEAYLTSVGDRVDIPFYDDLIFGDTDSAQPSVLCVAWAEARYKEWRLHMWWNAEKQLGCWTPTTDDLVEAELKLGGDWNWIHVLYSRVRTAEFRVLVGA